MRHGPQRESQKPLLAPTSSTTLRSVFRPPQLRSAFRILLLVPIAASVMANRTLVAAETASATITDQPLGGGVFQYNVALKDTGTTNVGTLWFSWVPGEDFMTTSPTNVLAPANWAGAVMHAGATDGYSIQFVNSSGSLTPGNTLSGFKFDSTMTPAQMAGDSVFYPTTPVTTSFVYSGAPFSDAGFQLTGAVQTPEPSSFILAALGGIGVLLLRCRPAGNRHLLSRRRPSPKRA